MAGISRAYKRRNNMVANIGGPVLCLDAGSRISYPGSGTTWTDLSGNGNTGTLTNGPTYSSANGGSIVFDGSNDYVDCGNSASLNLTTDISIAAIINMSSRVSFDIAVDRYSGVGNGYSLTLNAGVIRWSTNADNYEDSTQLDLNRFYYIVLTYGGGIKAIYKNGVMVQSKSFSTNIVSSGQNLLIGQRVALLSDSLYFHGLISSVSIYNRALSAAEISQNFNLLRGRYGI